MVLFNNRQKIWLVKLFLVCFSPLWSWAGEATKQTENSCHYDEVLKMDVWVSYTPDYAVREFKDYIRKKYQKNIDLHVNKVFSPDEFYDRVRAGISDIISPSHNFFKDEGTRLIDTGLLIPLDPSSIPNLESLDRWFVENDFASNNGKIYGVPVAAGGYNLLYNKDHVKVPPKSWNILWDDAYRGRYSISKDYYEANIYITAFALGYSKDQMSDIKLINTPVFKAKLKKLLQNANYWHGRPTVADLEKSVLTTGWGLSHSVSGDKTKQWRLAFPKEGVGFWMDYLAITRNTKRSEFAQKLAMEWLNFSIGKRFQSRNIIRDRNYISPLKETSLPKDVLAMQNSRELHYVLTHSVPWPLLTERNRNGIKLVYDEVVKEIEQNQK
ncbi:ABC transporter substrate-binding protein [Bdellovibrio sp. HCB2-146]|uniref:ABC transporter substrate-binding protein n=1 Tax=Bdellovibrio sp. HCB2-146 TaxID=3394362 RepID=UPI0039BC7CC3